MYPKYYTTGDEDDSDYNPYKKYKHMYPTDYRDNDIGDEYPDNRGCGGGWPSADVPPWNSHQPIKKTKDYSPEGLDYYKSSPRPYFPPERMKRGLWKTREGTVMAIKDMTDLHLENAIKHSVKHEKMDAVACLEKERERRAALKNSAKTPKNDPLHESYQKGFTDGYNSCLNKLSPDVGF